MHDAALCLPSCHYDYTTALFSLHQMYCSTVHCSCTHPLLYMACGVIVGVASNVDLHYHMEEDWCAHKQVVKSVMHRGKWPFLLAEMHYHSWWAL